MHIRIHIQLYYNDIIPLKSTRGGSFGKFIELKYICKRDINFSTKSLNFWNRSKIGMPIFRKTLFMYSRSRVLMGCWDGWVRSVDWLMAADPLVSIFLYGYHGSEWWLVIYHGTSPANNNTKYYYYKYIYNFIPLWWIMRSR